MKGELHPNCCNVYVYCSKSSICEYINVFLCCVSVLIFTEGFYLFVCVSVCVCVFNIGLPANLWREVQILPGAAEDLGMVHNTHPVQLVHRHLDVVGVRPSIISWNTKRLTLSLTWWWHHYPLSGQKLLSGQNSLSEPAVNQLLHW